MSALRLVAFTAAALPVIEPWFDDADTRRWLSDRRWPAMILFSLTNFRTLDIDFDVKIRSLRCV